ncbi:MAG: carbamoyltransferase HypF [Coriobacteriia bacterium]|nr:carbamoyltransferase HypF [Coriobacteriia bacterium]
MKALQLQVTGVVQGVGFRPFVYKLAQELSCTGWVLNASDGVHLCIEGSDALVDSFPQLLEARVASEAPAARIETLTLRSVPVSNFADFRIRPSQVDVNERTFISPDVASCEACLTELYTSDNRRYRYPFTNCTDCGPRFTIIEDTPYDRPQTTMRDFSLCEPCAAEYADPTDRRFHAQPNACFACGPRLYFNRSVIAEEESITDAGDDAAESSGDGTDSSTAACSTHTLRGRTLRDHWAWSAEEELAQIALGAAKKKDPQDIEWQRTRAGAILAEAAEVLTQGKILAVKGLGGFQLACNARSEIAVSRLRDRKFRWGKPLAVMFANIEQAARYVELNDEERALLCGTARPIVLCKRREIPDGGPDLALSVAPGLREIGVMLPYTPLHHLLLEEFYGPLVMTSGNVSGSPIVTDNATALTDLSAVADAFLLHDRPIAGRYDDSVLRIVDGKMQMIRRARGYAPLPLKGFIASEEEEGVPPLLAVGSEQKNTFALVDATPAGEPTYTFVSQHIGDLENSETLAAFADTIDQYQRLFKITPQLIAHDLHPEYLSTKWAQVQEEQSAGGKNPLQLIGVQHHHAHVMAAAAEHQVAEPVIGIAFDGTGYGTDGSIWGGEVLIASTAAPAFERFAHLRQFALPGGAAAIKRPIRILYALLDQYDLLDHPAAASIKRRLEKHEGATMLAMVEKDLNTPLTSSMGRLFDAVASLLGVADDATFEGAPAMMLEALSNELDTKPTPPRYRFALQDLGTDGDAVPASARIIIDPQPVIRALLDDLQAMEDPESELSVAELSRRFHDAVVTMIGDVSTKAARLYDLDTVVLAGGVFMNRLVLSGARKMLHTKGLKVLTNELLPPNDGSVSFGQLVVARAHQAANLRTESEKSGTQAK